jgi:peptidyl-prolyl cis-trans isomerase D
MQKSRIAIWLRNAALLLIIAAFIVFFGPQGQGGGGAGAIGEVNGELIDVFAFEYVRNQYRDEEQRLRDQGMTASVARDLVDNSVRQQLVELYLRAQAAREQGFEVSDAEVGRILCSQFADAVGHCDRALIKGGLQEMGFPDERRYAEFLRLQLLAGKQSLLLSQSIRISKAAARERLKRERTTLKLRYVRVPIEPAASAAQASEQEVEEFAERESARVAAEYDRRRAEFQKPEEVRARHILLTGAEAKQQAQAALDRIKGGEDFVKVAAELSKDPATAQAGGDLGFFPRNRMEPEFEKAAFDAEEKALVGPVETKRGVHVIRVEEKRAAVNRSLEDATPALARELLARDRGQTAARTRAEQLAAEIGKGKGLREVAAAQSLPVEETAEFAASATRLPGIAPIPGLQGAALSLTPEKPTSDQVFPADDGFYVIELAERKEPKPEELEGELEAGSATLTDRAQRELFEEIYRRQRQEAEAKGAILLPSLRASES